MGEFHLVVRHCWILILNLTGGLPFEEGRGLHKETTTCLGGPAGTGPLGEPEAGKGGPRGAAHAAVVAGPPYISRLTSAVDGDA